MRFIDFFLPLWSEMEVNTKLVLIIAASFLIGNIIFIGNSVPSQPTYENTSKEENHTPIELKPADVYISMATNDDYALCAIVLFQSLRDVNSTKGTVLLKFPSSKISSSLLSIFKRYWNSHE